MTQRHKGDLVVSSIPQFSLEQVYPDIIGHINLNTCGDPDCGNFGVAPDPCQSAFRGPGAGQRRSLAAMSNPAFTTGRGRYKLGAPSDDASMRVSTAFEYDGNPVAWSDGRILTC